MFTVKTMNREIDVLQGRLHSCQAHPPLDASVFRFIRLEATA